MKSIPREKGGSGPLSCALRLALAACMALSLFTDFTMTSESNYQNLADMTAGRTMPLFAMTVLFAVLLFWARGRFPRRGRGLTVLAVAMGAWWVLAQAYSNWFRQADLTASASQLLKAVIAFVGMSGVYDLLLRMLDDVLLRGADVRAGGGGRLRRAYRAHPALLCGAAVLLCWLPHLVIAWPVAMNADTANQVEQAMGLIPMNGNHPPFGTLVIGWALALGRALGSANAGLHALVLAQALLGAAVTGYAQATMRSLHAPVWLRALSLLVCAFSPCFCDNITVLLKDVPYSFSAMLLCCELARAVIAREPGYRESRGHALRYAAACLGMLLFRNNGLGIVLPVALLMLLGVRGEGRRAVLGTIARTLAPVLLGMLLLTGINAAYDVQPGSAGEALSLPFQQTARFVQKHHDEIPQEEREIIDAVLDADALASLYNPYISDPVKATYRTDAGGKALLAYFGVWAKQLLRDPLCYAQATLIQNALLFDPQTRNVAFFDVPGLTEAAEQALGVTKPDLLWRLTGFEMTVRELLFSLPLYAQLTSVGAYAILMLAVCVIARRERLRGMGVMLVVPVMTAVMIALGPCLLWQDRYGFPIIYCMPLALAALWHRLRQRQLHQ